MGKHSNASAPSCQNCPLGKYGPVASSSVCAFVCAAGKHGIAAGASGEGSGCTNCPGGKHQPASGTNTCLICGAGRFMETPGAPACKPCTAGRFKPLIASLHTECSNACEAGKYGNRTGTTNEPDACAQCPAGKFQAATGGALCLDCLEGQFQALTRQPSCADCPAGKYQPSTVATFAACNVSCAPGKYGTMDKAVSEALGCEVGAAVRGGGAHPGRGGVGGGGRVGGI